MKIKTLALKNFLGTKDATYILDKDLVTVSGRNGSGKSTIISGITYALYGIIMERSQIKGAINNEAPDGILSVVLTFSHGGKDYVLERSTNKIQKLNGDTFKQEDIDALFGSKEVVLSSSIVGHFMKYDISERYEILNSIIPFDDKSVYNELMGKLAEEFPHGSIDYKTAQKLMKDEDTRISAIRNNIMIKTASLNEVRNTVITINEDVTLEMIDDIRKTIAAHELQKPVYQPHQNDNTEVDIQEKELAILRKEYQDFLKQGLDNSDIVRLSSLYEQKKREIDAIKTLAMCSCCKRPFTDAEKESQITIINNDINVLAGEMRQAKADYETNKQGYESKKNQYEMDIASRENKIKALQINTTSGNDILHKNYIESLNTWTNTLNDLRASLSQKSIRLQAINADKLAFNNNQDRITQLEKEIVELQDTLASSTMGKLEKLVEVLSPKGLDFSIMEKKKDIIKGFFPENVDIVLSEKNATNDNFKKMFSISQDGVEYAFLSTGMRMVIDTHICDLFNSFTKTDLLFVDNAESLTLSTQLTNHPQSFRFIVRDEDLNLE